MNFKAFTYKQPLLAILLLLLTGGIFASEESMKLNKEETKDIMNLFMRENKSREMRLKPAIPVKIKAPVGSSKAVKRTSSAGKTAAAVTSKQPVIYNFKKSSVWGEFAATVIDYPGKNYFKVSYDIQYPAQYVEVFDGVSKNKVYKENLNDVSRYSMQVNYEFKPVYKLLLKVVINDEIQPVIIPLYEETTIKHK